MSSADRVKLLYVKETVPGTTPNAPALKTLRATGESLKRSIQTDTSKELDENREEREMIIIGASTAGDIQHELLWDGQEDFIAAVVGRDTWTVDGVNPKLKTVVNSNDLPHFSIIKQFKDLADINHKFIGMVVNGWSLTIAKKSIITGAFSLTGRGFANGTMATVVTGVATYPAVTNTDPMNGSSHVTSLLLDDVPFTSCIDNLTLSITNNIRPQECLGSIDPTGFTQGRLQITCSADIYFKDETLFNKYKMGTAFELDVNLTDNDGNQLSFELPRCKFEDVEVLATGTNGDVMAKCKFRALRDPTDGRMIKIASTAV